VVANWVEKFQSFRITLTFPVLNAAAQVIFLVSGESKARIVSDIFTGANSAYPSQMVHPRDGRLLWMLDQPAASLLTAGRD
jgi:6-phosphogluconolactonase